MILRDICELSLSLRECASAEEAGATLEENGEECDTATAETVFSYRKTSGGFLLSNDEAFYKGKKISCPDCKNSSPDKLIGSASELLSGSEAVHIGCCECGTQFSIG